MKIAIIQPRSSYHVAGSEKVSIKHVEYLSRAGHLIDLYTSTSEYLEETFLFKELASKKLKNVNILKFDISNSIPDLYKDRPDSEHIRWSTESLAFNEKIFSQIKENKPDIILTYYLPDSLFKPIDIPNVIYLSGYPSKPIKLYESFIKFCDATISISSTVSEKWSKEINGIKLKYSLATGVDFPPILKEEIKPKATHNLVFAGRIIERKGILTLLEAFKGILKTNSDIHLWILGEGDLREDLEMRVNYLNLGSKISILGLVKNPYDYFNMADICIFPSHQGDGLMGTVLESMSVGKPVVTTINNGNEDVIQNGINGILIKPNDSSEIVEAVHQLINDKETRLKIGLNASNFIKNNMTWEKHTEKLSNILTDILSKIEE